MPAIFDRSHAVRLIVEVEVNIEVALRVSFASGVWWGIRSAKPPDQCANEGESHDQQEQLADMMTDTGWTGRGCSIGRDRIRRNHNRRSGW